MDLKLNIKRSASLSNEVRNANFILPHNRAHTIPNSNFKKEHSVDSRPREFQIWNAFCSDFVFLIRIQLLFSITVGRS